MELTALRSGKLHMQLINYENTNLTKDLGQLIFKSLQSKERESITHRLFCVGVKHNHFD